LNHPNTQFLTNPNEPIMYTRIDEIEIILSLKGWITDHDGFEDDKILFEDGTIIKPKILFEVQKNGEKKYLSISEIKYLFDSLEEVKIEIDVTQTPSEYIG